MSAPGGPISDLPGPRVGRGKIRLAWFRLSSSKSLTSSRSADRPSFSYVLSVGWILKHRRAKPSEVCCVDGGQDRGQAVLQKG